MIDATGHLSDERIQEWLDGLLPSGESVRVQAHLDVCPRCRAEAEGWQALIADLSALPALAPGEGFRGRVLDAVGRAPERLPLAARIRARLAGWVAGADPVAAHPGSERLQDFLDGALSGRRAARVRGHLAACGDCRHEAQQWSALIGGLGDLPRLAPSPAFAHAVMAQVRIPEPVPARAALVRRVLDQVRALAGPRYRRAWAAAAGVALTPAIATALVIYTVFSHPLVTVANLGSYLWLEGAALLGSAGSGLMAGLVESAALFRAWSAVETLARSPATAGAGLLGFSVLTLTAVWVLYRNLYHASTAHSYAKAS